jgi:hydantoinase/carbamoylase family amidase
MATPTPTIDRARSAERIERDIETLAGPEYTRSAEAIRRYAYTPEYQATLDYLVRQLEAIGFEISYDPVGTLIARNRSAGERAFGVGSHCDSNRNGGKYDGTMGVVTALEVCRLNAELGLQLPLQLVSFLEEEGSGFGQMLLGSRITAQRVTEEDLREHFRAIDDGRSFWEHAEEAGNDPARWRDSIHILDDLAGWIELHIEQARVLQDTGNRIGIVTAIAGYIHADVFLEGRADHAGATPMDFRLDVAPAAARVILEVERLARQAGNGTVATVGEIEFQPGLINVVPGRARLSLDTRGVVEEGFQEVARRIEAFVEQTAAESGLAGQYRQRQTLPATPMDQRLVGALEAAAVAAGEPFMLMPSGAAHDTMSVAAHVPSAMVFVPCVDGISHAPEEDADPADAALGAEIILNAIRSLQD